MVRCEDGSHYTGITTDPHRRMREHVLRLTPGAKYTKSHRVIALDALWSAQTRSEACRLEAAVKRLHAEQKRALIAQPDRLHDFLGARIALHARAALFSRRAALRTELTQNARRTVCGGHRSFLVVS